MDRWVKIAGVLLSFASAAPCLAADDNCRLTLYADLDVELHTEAVMVPVSVNGTAAWMQFDTGLAASVLLPAAAKQLDLPVRGISASLSVGGSSPTGMASVSTLKLGNLTIPNASLLLIPRTNVQGVPSFQGKPLIGHLGLDMLGRVDYELDLGAKKLRIFSPDHCPGKVVYWTRTYSEMAFSKDALGNLYFPLELEGKQVEATLSTARAITTVDSGVTRQSFGFDEDSPEITREASAKGDEVASFRAMALTAPAINISNTKVRLTKETKHCRASPRKSRDVMAIAFARCVGVFPLKLGLNVLTQLRIYVSTNEKIIYISRADAT